MNQIQLCEQVLTACRTELCQLYPALNTAFASLPCRMSGNGAFSTDGSFFYTSPAVLNLFAENPTALRRGYLHVLIHCLYLHIFPPKLIEPALWNLACDIWTEKLISELQEPTLETPNPLREQYLNELGAGIQTPESLMRLIEAGSFSGTREELEKAFQFDDHSLWQKELPQELRKKWEGAMPGGGNMGQGSRGSKSVGDEELPALQKMSAYDYRRFLRQYAVSREEIETDTDSFDYIYYSLGMEQYGNLPLLEPLEYKEVWRLDTIAIAIDTSNSCDRELVSRFLEETYGILYAEDSFFRKMSVYFFQCDCVLQDAAVIRSRENWEAYAAQIRIRGRGGTDFRPVFREIENRRRIGTMSKPRVLLYFTDGDGVYPTIPPDFDTVFVLAGKNQHPELVPKWAKKLILE